ncbi:cation/H(+) antiporter 15 [Phtheirospermum japonicum]|uniref:Cation/H(+) antiporter 15 n=1 Tax=Phtheirospermum japonicum TaxID=374723 RepID=A0A830B6D2_9LAMI|nr:cation/H(+) antiporter 15 [Phtheirospermum japonicum]
MRPPIPLPVAINQINSRGLPFGDNPLRYSVAISLSTRLLHCLLRPVGQPLIVAQILGHQGRNLSFLAKVFPVKSRLVLDTVSSFGFMLFVFIIGVKMDISVVMRSGKKAMTVGILGFFVPPGLSGLAAFLLGNFLLLDRDVAKSLPHRICWQGYRHSRSHGVIGSGLGRTGRVAVRGGVSRDARLLVSLMLLSPFLSVSGLKVDVFCIQNLKNVGVLQLIVVVAFVGKIVGSMLPPIICRMPFRDALSLGLIINSKGIVELTILNDFKNQDVSIVGLNADILSSFKFETRNNDEMVYKENVVSSGMDVVTVARSVVNVYNLVMVGRRHGDSPIMVQLGKWNELGDLGAIGEILAASEFRGKASVLVVQQQTRLWGLKDPEESTHLRRIKL